MKILNAIRIETSLLQETSNLLEKENSSPNMGHGGNNRVHPGIIFVLKLFVCPLLLRPFSPLVRCTSGVIWSSVAY